jgi:Cu+-exporting ATPase
MIVFDKTGTLTEGGAPRVTNAEIFPSRASLSRSGVLGVASALESASSHPLAAAIRWYCEQEQADFVEAYNFEEVSGRGLKAHIEGVGSTAIIGNEAWMIEHGATIPSNAQELINSWKNEAKSVVLLALSPTTEGQFYLAAAFAIADVIRPEAKSVIASLKKQNIAVWMISGDNIVTAKAVARLVGIEEANIIADVLPHEKVGFVLKTHHAAI